MMIMVIVQIYYLIIMKIQIKLINKFNNKKKIFLKVNLKYYKLKNKKN